MLDQAASTKIIEYCKLKKYPWKEFNIVYLEGVNINGVLNSDAPDMFNDVRAVFNPTRCLDCWQATSEPGRWYTDFPLNWLGAFRIAFGFHDRAWEIGIHGNSEPHEALVQVSEVAGYRDYNKDMIRTGDQRVVGVYGINQHHGYDLPPNSIGQASAGCLVGRTRFGHQQFMQFCRNSGLTRFSTIVLPADKVFV
jgi:hypothetical protein